MRIQGFFRDEMGFVRAHLSSISADVDASISFLADTGASKTVLLDKDALLLNINYDSLKKFEQNLSGIGGSVETYVIDDAVLTFKSETGKVEFESQIFVLRHNLEELPADEKIKILSIPSILGRDIIRKFSLLYTIEFEELVLKGLKKKKL